MTKYYAVFRGRKTGIFTRWPDCERQVKGFSGARYKSYATRQEAEAALQETQLETGFNRNEAVSNQRSSSLAHPQTGAQLRLITPHTPIADSICVDAACSGNPGLMEYRGVDTTTRAVLFHEGPFPNGTNNLGEFLAIAHGLALLQQQGRETPLYSDSATAILWVKNRRVRTTLTPQPNNREIFDRLDRALAWLQTHDYVNPVLKWDTANWGEIPADFGRKK